MDINVVAENLAELLTNSVNMTQVYYDLFFNPEPMDITLYQYDDDNKLVEVVIPNRAKDKIRLEEIAAEIATRISNTEKGQPDGVATLDENGKVPLSQMQVINDNVVATDTTYSSSKIEAKFAEESDVVHKAGAETITGSKTFTANTYIGTSSTKANLNMNGDLSIQGNIIQNGDAYETHAEQVYSKDDYIILRDGATAGLATGDYAGFQVIKYDGVNNGRLVIDNKGEARVGDEGDEQPLLTRNESANMTANALIKWDAINNKAVTTTDYYDKTQVDDTVVHKTGNETINGVKTFTSGPILPIVNINTTGDAAVRRNNTNFVRMTNSGSLVLSGNANTMYLRPNGDVNTEGSVSIDTTGNVTAEKFTGPLEGTATNAVHDGAGNDIASTYATKVDLGDITTLETTDKDSAVEAINEIFNSVKDDVVHNTGAETINGVKTFTDTIKGTIENAESAVNDGAGNDIASTYATKTENDAKADDTEVVHKAGAETISGVKTFTVAPKMTSANFAQALTINRSTANTASAIKFTVSDALVGTIGVTASKIPTFSSDGANTYPIVHLSSATAVGSATIPVYVNANGVPVAITSYGGNSATATKATQDASGNVITTTYATQTTTGKLTDLTTTDKSSLVAAINEVKGAVPDTSNLVHTTGNETIGGVKTFTSTIVGTINNATNATNATKATQDASGNVITATYATQATTGNLSDLVTTSKTNLVAAINEVRNAVPDVTNVVHNTGNETVAGIKTFTSDLTTSATGVNITNTTSDVSVKKGGTAFVRLAATGSLVLSGRAQTMHFRPNGDISSVGAATLDVNGNFTATKFTGPLTGNVTGNVSGSSGSCTGNSATATKATQDDSGNVITSTYVKSLTVSGQTITITKGDNTTSTITTQDNKVQSVVSAGNAKYPIHLNNGTAATTNTTLIDTSIYANPSTNTIGADVVSIASKVNISYNSNTVALDFNFA